MSNHAYYETMYILRPDIPEEEVESHLKKYSEILSKTGAEILDNQMRGKRRLAYSIGKSKEGIYVQLSHKGDGQQISVLEKAMRLSEDVIRYLTVKQYGALPTPRPTPSPEEKQKEKSSAAKEKESQKEVEDKKSDTTEEKEETKE